MELPWSIDTERMNTQNAPLFVVSAILLSACGGSSLTTATTRHASYVDGIELPINSATTQTTKQAILESLTLDDTLPKIRIDGEVRILIDPVDCFVSNDDGAASSPVFTGITVVSVDNPSAYRTVCYNEESNGVYVSEDSPYLTQPRPNPLFIPSELS